MNTHNDFLDPARSENNLSFPTRREFLTAVASCSGALVLGLPSLVRAGGRQPSLQRQVSELVKGMRLRGLIRPEEKTSWSIYDLTSRKKLVAINKDVPRQAASMIKPFVAQAYFYKLKDARGKLHYTGEVRKTMEDMIRHSNNRATNRIMAIVSRHERNRGPKDIERILKKKAPGVFRETRIVESIPPDGRTYRNLASAYDYSRFLYALWHNHMPFTGELREIMALPNQDRICHGVSSIPDDVRIYDKTGSTARLCGNMGIVEAPGRWGGYYPYIFVGIIERPSRAKHYGSWITQRSDAIRAVSELVYQDMKQRYQLV